MGTKVKSSVAVLVGSVSLVLVVVAVAVLCWKGAAEPATDGVGSTDPDQPAPNGVTSEIAGIDRSLDREDVETPRAEPGTGADAPTSVRRGRVIDLRGVGVVGVALTVGESGADGAFEFSSSIGADPITSVDPRWATVRAGSSRVSATDPSTVIVAPRIEIRGRVVDADGQPLVGANVRVHLPRHLAVNLGLLLDGSVPVTWLAHSDPRGHFVLRDVPAVARAELAATLGGYSPRFVGLPASSTEMLELVLDRPAEGAPVIEGVVVDALDVPVAGARVSAGGDVSRTDDRGGFTIDLSSGRTLDRIVAIAKGMQPAVHVPERDAAGQPTWPARVVLRLGHAPRSITGTVLDRDRRPVAGAKVWIDDPLVVGFDGDASLLAETFLGREDQPFWAYVLTDRTGTFRLDGLLGRAYVVRALDPSTLVAVTRADVQAGRRGVDLQLAAETYPELRGRVVGRDGSAMAGVSVRLTRPALAVRMPGHPDSSMFRWAQSAPIETDAAGVFVLRDVPAEGVEIHVFGDAIQTLYKRVEPGMGPEALVLRVDRRLRLQVELAVPTDRADEVRVLSAMGRRMLLEVGGSKSSKWPLLDGRTEVLSLGEGARTVVFFKGGVEVWRKPVELKVGTLNTIRL